MFNVQHMYRNKRWGTVSGDDGGGEPLMDSYSCANRQHVELLAEEAEQQQQQTLTDIDLVVIARLCSALDIHYSYIRMYMCVCVRHNLRSN